MPGHRVEHALGVDASHAPHQVQVAAADAGDAPAITALWHLAGLVRPWNDPAHDIALALAHPASEVLVARTGRSSSGQVGGGVVVGSVVVGSAVVGFDGHRGWVYYLAVHPDHRRRGTGAALLAAAKGWLRDVGAPKVQLMVRTDNAGVVGFYERLGYQVQDVAVLGRRLD